MVGVALAEFYSFEFYLLCVLGKSYFKAPKVSLDECFYQCNVQFSEICTKNRLWAIIVWKDECGTTWMLFICVVLTTNIKERLLLSFKKFRWTNILIIEIFILAIFVEKVNLERSRTFRVGIKLCEFYLFVVPSFGVLGESCSKTSKVPLDKCFYHWMFIFANFVQKIAFSNHSCRVCECICWILFVWVVPIASFRRKLFQSSRKSVQKSFRICSMPYLNLS